MNKEFWGLYTSSPIEFGQSLLQTPRLVKSLQTTLLCNYHLEDGTIKKLWRWVRIITNCRRQVISTLFQYQCNIPSGPCRPDLPGWGWFWLQSSNFLLEDGLQQARHRATGGILRLITALKMRRLLCHNLVRNDWDMDRPHHCWWHSKSNRRSLLS